MIGFHQIRETEMHQEQDDEEDVQLERGTGFVLNASEEETPSVIINIYISSPNKSQVNIHEE